MAASLPMDGLRIVVGSTNPVKQQAARDGFAAMYPHLTLDITGLEAPSGVSDQPFGDAETMQGALNRARYALQAMREVDYAVGIEGGVGDLEGHDGLLMVFAWVVIVDRSGKIGKARSGAFQLPDEIAQLVRQGLELGDADDQVFGQQNSKQRNGSVGLLTGDALTRTGFYAPAVLMALIPFKNPQLSFGE
jgi:inosine/xanthosine triphosphatase